MRGAGARERHAQHDYPRGGHSPLPAARGEVEGAKRRRVRGLSAILSGAVTVVALQILVVRLGPAERPPHPDPLPACGERE